MSGKCIGNAVILLAGGSGSRMRGLVKDKTLFEFLGVPVIIHSFKAFIESGCVDKVVFVCRDDEQIEKIASYVKEYYPKLEGVELIYTYGGKQRQDSVLNGLRAVNAQICFIHDSARPLVGKDNIRKLCKLAKEDGASVLANRVSDTIKRQEGSDLVDLDRTKLWAMQTPQVFNHKQILSAYEHVSKNEIAITDDVAAATLSGISVSVVENFDYNPKITLPEDIALAEFIFKAKVEK